MNSQILTMIIENPFVITFIFIGITVSATLSSVSVFQVIRYLMTCNANGKMLVSRKEMIANIILDASVIYICRYLMENGYHGKAITCMMIIAFIALTGMIFSIIILVSGKIANGSVKRYDK